MIDADDKPGWHGWHYDGKAWRRVCTASTIHECSARLSRAVPHPVTNLHWCITTGALPRDIPHRR